MDFKPTLSLNSIRRFGAEIEINAFDGLSRTPSKDILPKGIEYVGNLVRNTTEENVTIHKWGNDHYNESWIIKPDGSCGLEVCSPVVKGWNGVIKICKVVDAFNEDKLIKSDSRCSFHVHIDVSDLHEAQIASVLTWWIKCEPVFIDSMPLSRKNNQYCQFIGLTPIVEFVEDGLFSNDNLIKKLGDNKYYTINTYHYNNKKRKTIEFRIMDNNCCLDSWCAKNWLRLVLHFVERSIIRGLPDDYRENDRWSGYCWLDPLDVFEFLGFYEGQYNLSPALAQVKTWFSSRLNIFGKQGKEFGILSDKSRSISILQVNSSEEFKLKQFAGNYEEIYSEKYRI